MTQEVRIDLLGPLRVSVDGRLVEVTGQRRRVILAALALSAGSPVDSDVLADYVWGEQLPGLVRPALHTAVTRLRQVLGVDVISSTAGSYTLSVPPSAVDVFRFRAAVAAVGHTTDIEESGLLGEALAMWRGEPLQGVESNRLEADFVPGLTEEWFAATERHTDLRLAAGDHTKVVATLRDLTARHPYRESLWARLMVALYRSGRQADALAAYQTVRSLLRDRLGVEPGAQLRDAQRMVLSGEPVPETTGTHHTEAAPGPTVTSDAGQSAGMVPRQLPTHTRTFTGRTEQLTALDALLTSGDDGTGEGGTRPGPIVIASLGGVGGIGKTALAVYWAHRVADQFPDGQLYVNLRGYGPGDPLQPTTVLASFLHAFGTPPERIPPDADARAALFRSTLAGRRVLMVLDNARDEAQVRPLLPGSGTVVLVTSRNQMRGLATREGATRITLPQLSRYESLALLRRILGAEAPSDTDDASRLAALCGHLPLALAIAAERITRASGRDLPDLVDELHEEYQRLDALHTGDDTDSDVRAVFSWSYQSLKPESARMFRLLSLIPGGDTSTEAAAALTGTTVRQARRLLDSLVAVHQLQERQPGRYEQHDLIRAYATELTQQYDSDDERRVAVRRILDWYLHTGVAAREQAGSVQPIENLGTPTDGADPMSFPDVATALAWLEAEHRNLPAAVEYAAAHGHHRHAWQIAAVVRAYLNLYRPWQHSLPMLQTALHSARTAGDAYGEAFTLAGLGDAHHFLGEPEESVRVTGQALAIYQKIGNRMAQAGMLSNIGMTLVSLGRPDEAVEAQQQALTVALELEIPRLTMLVLHNLAAGYVAAGRYTDGINMGRQALALSRTEKNRLTEANALDELGNAYSGLGRHAEAIDHLTQALRIYQELESPLEVASLMHVASAHRAEGNVDALRKALHSALDTAARWGDRQADDIRAELAALDRTTTTDDSPIRRRVW